MAMLMMFAPTGSRGAEKMDFPAWAVVDRLVDGRWAVLLVEPGMGEMIVNEALLPSGWTEGSWLRLERRAECDEIIYTLDLDRTEAMRARIAAKLELLRERTAGSTQGSD